MQYSTTAETRIHQNKSAGAGLAGLRVSEGSAAAAARVGRVEFCGFGEISEMR